MKKGDVGMAKRFSKKYGNKGWASTTCNPMSAPDATSLHHCLKQQQNWYAFSGKYSTISYIVYRG